MCISFSTTFASLLSLSVFSLEPFIWRFNRWNYFFFSSYFKSVCLFFFHIMHPIWWLRERCNVAYCCTFSSKCVLFTSFSYTSWSCTLFFSSFTFICLFVYLFIKHSICVWYYTRFKIQICNLLNYFYDWIYAVM